MGLAFMLLSVCFRAGRYAGVASAGVFFTQRPEGRDFWLCRAWAPCSGKAASTEVSGRGHVLVGLYIHNGHWVSALVPASHSHLRHGPRGLDRGRG